MSDGKRWDVKAAVKSGADEKTIWIKVGSAFRAFPDQAYEFKLNLQALPVSAFTGAAIELYLFPWKAP